MSFIIRFMCAVSLLLCFKPVYSNPIFFYRECHNLRIVPVNSVEEIDFERSKDILIRGFMKSYDDVPLSDLSVDFKSIGNVRRYYENYFENEVESFKEGELIWMQAFEGENLVGWATFQLENDDEAYMNILVVDPKSQGRGIGKHLTFSIKDLFPNLKAINLLIRTVNTEGRKFYKKIGFFEFVYIDDSFFDTSLLEGLRFEFDKK